MDQGLPPTVSFQLNAASLLVVYCQVLCLEYSLAIALRKGPAISMPKSFRVGRTLSKIHITKTKPLLCKLVCAYTSVFLKFHCTLTKKIISFQKYLNFSLDIIRIVYSLYLNLQRILSSIFLQVTKLSTLKNIVTKIDVLVNLYKFSSFNKSILIHLKNSYIALKIYLFQTHNLFQTYKL